MSEALNKSPEQVVQNPNNNLDTQAMNLAKNIEKSGGTYDNLKRQVLSFFGKEEKNLTPEEQAKKAEWDAKWEEAKAAVKNKTALNWEVTPAQETKKVTTYPEDVPSLGEVLDRKTDGINLAMVQERREKEAWI